MWSDENVELLKKLWSEGFSCSQIAARLTGDISRNAVIGKATRLKLAPRRGRPDPGKRGRSKLRRTKGKVWGHTQSEAAKKRQSLPAVIEAYVEPVTDERPTRTFATLAIGECKWPIGDPREAGFGYCGCKAIPLQVYCETHHKRAHAPQPGVKRKKQDDVSVPADSVREREGVSQ